MKKMITVAEVVRTYRRLPVGAAFPAGHPHHSVTDLEITSITGLKVWYIAWGTNIRSIVVFPAHRSEPRAEVLHRLYIHISAYQARPSQKGAR